MEIFESDPLANVAKLPTFRSGAQQLYRKLQPDLLLDLNMAGALPTVTAAAVRADCPAIKTRQSPELFPARNHWRRAPRQTLKIAGCPRPIALAPSHGLTAHPG
jgi:hypothetical protein